MGHYTAYAFHLRFKPDTPPAVITAVKQLAGLVPHTGFEYAESYLGAVDHLENLRSMMSGSNTRFKGWDGYVRESTVDGAWQIVTKASCKVQDVETPMTFLRNLLPYLVIDDGEILYRSLYEDATQEHVAYVEDGHPVHAYFCGYRYGDVWDSDHPRTGGDPDWDPPMNIVPLRELLKVKKAESDKKNADNFSGYGF